MSKPKSDKNIVENGKPLLYGERLNKFDIWQRGLTRKEHSAMVDWCLDRGAEIRESSRQQTAQEIFEEMDLIIELITFAYPLSRINFDKEYTRIKRKYIEVKKK